MAASPFLSLVLAGTLALGACGKSQSAEADRSFDERVHAYLLAHPEVIQEAIDKLQEKQAAQAAQQASTAIRQNRQAIEHDPRDFVANPNGKITVTEFYDYRCPHCINAAPAVLSLIHDNPDIRFVFKEFPIFGAESDRAAMAAIAIKQAGGDYLGAYHDMMSAKPLDDAAINQVLTAHGVAPAKLDDPAFKTAAAAQLSDIRHLAVTTLSIEGTPAFIVGDTLVPGEDMDAVRTAITQARPKPAG